MGDGHQAPVTGRGLLPAHRRPLVAPSSFVRESFVRKAALGHLEKGDPVNFRILDSTSLVRRCRDHHALMCSDTLNLGSEYLNILPLDRIVVELGFYKDEEVHAAQSVPDRHVDYVAAVDPFNAVTYRDF
jgi:hypothetical protein